MSDSLPPTGAPDLPDSIAGLLAAQESGRLSAVEIARSRLAAVASSTLGAIVAGDAEAVLAAAADLDARRARGERLGPLAGVPVSVKDAFAVAGLRASVGVASTVHESAEDAPAVALLRAADALLLGKSNVPPYLDSFHTANDVYGVTRNPWSRDRSAGGSSGGSAAAVAAGLSAGDLGSDLVGSIRVPAAWCGVFGHRPTTGVIAKRGHLPWPMGTELDPTASTAGPLARSAEDLAALFGVLAAPVGVGARMWRLALPEPSFAELRGLRVGLWLEPERAPIDAETQEQVTGFADRLTEAGCTVVPVDGSALSSTDAEELFDRLVQHEIAFGADLAGSRPDAVAPGERGAPVSAVWADLDAQLRIRSRWERVFDAVDVVIAPVVPFAAPPAETAESETADVGRGPEGQKRLVGRWSCMANLAMGPCTVVPVGLGSATGLPAAVQVIGRSGDDLATLAFARLCERDGIVPRLRPPA